MISMLLISLALLLVLLNAFFVAAEFSMVKLRSTQVASIKSEYGLRGSILEIINKDLDKYLSACQLGITLTSLSLGWIGEPAFAVLLEEVLRFFNIDIFFTQSLHILAFSMAFGLITFLHIVVGELVPKSMAIRRAIQVAVWTAMPLYIFCFVMYPAIWLLNLCANSVLKITGGHFIDKYASFYSTEEIKKILHLSRKHGELTRDETEILKRTLVFADLNVVEVMMPFEDLIVLDSNQTLEKAGKFVKKHRYSRYPVYDRKNKKFIGLIHVKDLFLVTSAKASSKSITKFMRPLVKVSDDFPAIELLKKFREGRSHFALIYGQDDIVCGFATLDNLLHTLIGYVKDEFHKTKEQD